MIEFCENDYGKAVHCCGYEDGRCHTIENCQHKRTINKEHIICNKEELLRCNGLFEAWKLGVKDTLEQTE